MIVDAVDVVIGVGALLLLVLLLLLFVVALVLVLLTQLFADAAVADAAQTVVGSGADTGTANIDKVGPDADSVIGRYNDADAVMTPF